MIETYDWHGRVQSSLKVGPNDWRWHWNNDIWISSRTIAKLANAKLISTNVWVGGRRGRLATSASGENAKKTGKDRNSAPFAGSFNQHYVVYVSWEGMRQELIHISKGCQGVLFPSPWETSISRTEYSAKKNLERMSLRWGQHSDSGNGYFV